MTYKEIEARIDGCIARAQINSNRKGATTMPEKKTSIVKRLLAEGSHKKALSIAKGFKLGITKEESSVMARAYECMVHGDFYRQIGRNLDEEISAGIAVLKRLYGAKS